MGKTILEEFLSEKLCVSRKGISDVSFGCRVRLQRPWSRKVGDLKLPAKEGGSQLTDLLAGYAEKELSQNIAVSIERETEPLQESLEEDDYQGQEERQALRVTCLMRTGGSVL